MTETGEGPRTILGADFFARRTLTVARDLIGKFLVRRRDDGDVALMITETEAYDGFGDKASHAYRGRTQRNAPMFDKAGTIYVYFTYGMHFMLNLVCGDEAHPAAVLIRGAGDIVGPARLTKALGIDRVLNHKLLGVETGLWVEDHGVKVSRNAIATTPRIGIPYAAEYIDKPWRFVLRGSPAAKTLRAAASGQSAPRATSRPGRGQGRSR